MNNTPTSPERLSAQPVGCSDADTVISKPKVGSPKIKYTRKAKRKRSVPNTTGDSPSEQSDSRQSVAMDNSQEESLCKSTPALQKVEVLLPGSSPHRSQSDSKESQVLSAKPLSKARASSGRASSVIPLKDSRHENLSVRSVGAKSPHTSPTSKTNRPGTPDNDADEASSIAESSVGNRIIRRSEPDRIQYFKEQSQCDEVEPHRAHCSRCNKWVSLGKRQTYCVRPWELHRRRCDQRERLPVSMESHPVETEGGEPEGDVSISGSSVQVIAQPSLQSADGETEEEKQKPEVLVSESSLNFINQSSPQSTRKNEAERKVLLEADPRAQEVRPHEALCRSCQKWIKLGRPYNLGSWQAHQQRCSGVVLSRVATTERKISLLNDPQVKESSPRNVECAFCRTNVELDGVAQYDLTKWYEHKAKCSAPAVQPTPRGPTLRRSHAFPPPPDQTFAHVPTSRVHTPATSSNSTTVNDASLPRIGEKRPRDEEELVEDRPINRPRTETYQAPQQEAPGPWGWFMQPLKAFVRGFREGLGTPST